MTDIFIKILGMSAAASIVILALILLRLFLRKAPKIFSYVMWAAALFRLLCPITFELPAAPVPRIEIPYTEMTAAADMNDLFITNTENADVPVISEPQPTVTDNAPVPAEVRLTEKAKPQMKINFLAAVSYLWAAAAAAMLLRGIISWIRLSYSLRPAQKIGISVYVSSAISNPFIIGLIRPRIYLPAGLTCGESKLIIMHERTHMRRGDHIAKLVMYLALCIHCFNPLVWIMFRLFERDMEMSCDETVTANMDSNQKADYSQTLLKISAKPAAAFTACFGESGTKQRIKNVLNFKKPAVWVIIVLAIAAAAVSVMLCASRKEPAEEKTETVPLSETADTVTENTDLIPAMGVNHITGYMKQEDYYGGPENDKYEKFSETITDEETLETLYKQHYPMYGENVYSYTFVDKYILVPLYDETGEKVVDYFRMGGVIPVPPEDDEYNGFKDEIELIPLTEERQKSIYFGSQFPDMLYADSHKCLFTDGFGGLYLYDFQHSELLSAVDFAASMAVANADIAEEDNKYGGAVIYSRITGTGEKYIQFAFETKGKEKRGGEFNGRLYYLPSRESSLRMTMSYDNLQEPADCRPVDASMTDAVSENAAWINKRDYVYIVNSGLADDVVPGKESQLPMIRLARNINGYTEYFDPFADGLIPEEKTAPKEWGLSFTAVDARPDGVTVKLSRTCDRELTTGSDFIIERKGVYTWIEPKKTAAYYLNEPTWTSEAIIIPKDGEITLNAEWSNIYGELDYGHYRIRKSFRMGNDEEQFVYADFHIEYTER